MNKMSKICLTVVVAVLVLACVLGIATRFSYQDIDVGEAVYSLSVASSAKNAAGKLKTSSVLKELSDVESVFVVLVKSSEKSCHATKTVVTVERVIKGDEAETNQEIVIYEPNYFSYSTYRKCLVFTTTYSLVNNIMTAGKEYLVFCEKIEYADSYQKTLSRNEYTAEIDIKLYSFPLEYSMDYIELDSDDLTYADLQGYDYICFTQEDADKLDKIRVSVLEEYLQDV